MILRINNGFSCFESKVKQVFDSVYVNLSAISEQQGLQKAADASRKPGKSEFHYSIFKEPAQNLVFYHDIIGTKDYQYQEKAPLFNWKIAPTRRAVAGYDCQQSFTAFEGRMFEVWFTRDVPVSEGPYKFYGLPGLIVKVRDTHDNYVFELFSIESDTKPFDISADSGAPLSASPLAPLIKKAKFNQAKHNDDLTLLDQLAGAGNHIPESLRASHIARLKRQNNPLELK